MSGSGDYGERRHPRAGSLVGGMWSGFGGGQVSEPLKIGLGRCCLTQLSLTGPILDISPSEQ